MNFCTSLPISSPKHGWVDWIFETNIINVRRIGPTAVPCLVYIFLDNNVDHFKACVSPTTLNLTKMFSRAAALAGGPSMDPEKEAATGTPRGGHVVG